MIFVSLQDQVVLAVFEQKTGENKMVSLGDYFFEIALIDVQFTNLIALLKACKESAMRTKIEHDSTFVNS